ncbi:MAG: hypothetical protein AAGE61_02330 [Pseudomonadota bacterium]
MKRAVFGAFAKISKLASTFALAGVITFGGAAFGLSQSAHAFGGVSPVTTSTIAQTGAVQAAGNVENVRFRGGRGFRGGFRGRGFRGGFRSRGFRSRGFNRGFNRGFRSHKGFHGHKGFHRHHGFKKKGFFIK